MGRKGGYVNNVEVRERVGGDDGPFSNPVAPNGQDAVGAASTGEHVRSPVTEHDQAVVIDWSALGNTYLSALGNTYLSQQDVTLPSLEKEDTVLATGEEEVPSRRADNP